MFLSDVVLAALLNTPGYHLQQFWYALPLVVAVSLVYGGTRHEEMIPILQHAARAAIWIGGFMLALLALLLALSWWFL